jgi:hypothetical protein
MQYILETGKIYGFIISQDEERYFENYNEPSTIPSNTIKE